MESCSSRNPSDDTSPNTRINLESQIFCASDTPVTESAVAQSVCASTTSSVKALNVNAQEFKPGNLPNLPGSATKSLRSEAPAFVPGVTAIAQPLLLVDPTEAAQEDLTKLIESVGFSGMPVKRIPHAFFRMFGRHLDLSLCHAADLSVLLDSLPHKIAVLPLNDIPPQSAEDALALAGFLPGAGVDVPPLPEAPSPAVEEEAAAACAALAPLGLHAARWVVDSGLVDYTKDLAKFKTQIVEVVTDFSVRNRATRNTRAPTGLALSLFAAEWEKFFGFRVDLKTQRTKFCVTKLMPFLQALPELDVIGVHPEVRVRLRAVEPAPQRAPQVQHAQLQNLLSMLAAAAMPPPPQPGLSLDEVKTLLKKVIDRRPNEILSFSQIREDWKRYYPCLLPLDTYAPRLAEVLEQLPNTAVLGDRLVPMRCSPPPQPTPQPAQTPAALLAKLEELVRAAGGAAALKPALMKLTRPAEPKPDAKTYLEKVIKCGRDSEGAEKEVMQKLLNQLFVTRVTVADENNEKQQASRIYTKAALLQSRPRV